MGLLSPAIKSFLKLRSGVIDNFMLNPIDTQKQVFHDLISSAQFTEYGKKYDFQHLNSMRDFQQAVPLNNYDSLKPYIQRILQGEQNILWPSEITWFAKSSGTTSDKSKFIPVSRETLDDNHFKGGKDAIALYLARHPESRITSGKCLVIGGSHQLNQLSEDSFYGDLSAVMMQNMPWTAQVWRTPDLSIALMDEWEEKIEKIARSTIQENVTFITGVPTWTIVLFKRILEITGAKNMLEVWPNLELYIHGGVSFKPYREQFRQFIPSDDMKYVESYNASEGFFAIQDTDDSEAGMLLLLNHGIFFEFIPMDEFGKDKPVVHTLKEVKTGINYAIVVSTNTGLWRYIIGDTIQFVSLAPYRIKVSGRTSFFLNAFGEEVIVDNADEAIARASKATGAIVNDYSAAPVFMTGNTNGTHEWVIEFEYLPCPLEVFTGEMDKALQQVNSDYEAKRHKDIALRMPVVHRMPAGGFAAWLKHKNKLGGQHKVPRLSNSRTILEELLAYTQ
ncbi:GH3 auxin-responsive promoter family protein [Rurimicrobium arvi]|uniref:GH3 auxin-responsive promoter family protein n=1 Tax=Rurimicrobium arvi TaxID=2049916 RepID=A0ABP8MCY8_9BACT